MIRTLSSREAEEKKKVLRGFSFSGPYIWRTRSPFCLSILSYWPVTRLLAGNIDGQDTSEHPVLILSSLSGILSTGHSMVTSGTMTYPGYVNEHRYPVVTRPAKRTHHGLHAVITLATCGVWLPVWMIAWAMNSWHPANRAKVEWK